jgi:hypothetical protein
MTSLLPPSGLGFLHSAKPSAQLPSHLFFKVNSDDRHGDNLSVSGFAKGSKPHANNTVFLCEFGDEVRIGIWSPLIEDHDGFVDGTCFADDGHHVTSRRSMQ